VHSMHVYEIRPRKDHRGFDLISDVLPPRKSTEPMPAVDLANLGGILLDGAVSAYQPIKN